MAGIGPNQLSEIVKMAQQVASKIASNPENNIDISDGKNIDMSKIISQVTNSVSTMITPEFIEKVSSSAGQNSTTDLPEVVNQIANSKIQLESPVKKQKKSVPKIKIENDESKIEELDENENLETIRNRTKDLHFTLNVTLEDLYLGKTKKLAVRRQRIVTDINGKKVVEEKKKLLVQIEPGMFDEQIITFNKQADEKEGYETGDIIITLCCTEHKTYERENNNLVIEKEISLSEIFNCEMTIEHLNKNKINIKCNNIEICGDELDLYKKLPGYGMPILDEKNKFGDLIIKFKPIIPKSITKEHQKILNEIFPKINLLEKLSSDTIELEMTTESDFEFSDSESSDDFETDSEEEESESESDVDSEEEESEEEEEEESEEEEEEEIKKSKRGKNRKSK